MKVIIDKFEGDFAIAELPSGKMHSLPRAFIPDASEGDTVIIEIDREETQNRRAKIEKLAKEVWND